MWVFSQSSAQSTTRLRHALEGYENDELRRKHGENRSGTLLADPVLYFTWLMEISGGPIVLLWPVEHA